jgi:uncharacterized repeat protein (TIGR03803 family)
MYDGGTAFKLTPTGAKVLLYSFDTQFGVGSCPYAGLVFDKQGNLYGTTNYGGTYGLGMLFRITPDRVETILHSFGDKPGDGQYPLASLIFDKGQSVWHCFRPRRVRLRYSVRDHTVNPAQCATGC